MFVCLDVAPLQDAIVPFVMPFVTENIGKKATPEDWRLREAATFAFGSMLEGPSPATMAEIVRQAMGFLLAVSLLIRTSPRRREAVWPAGLVCSPATTCGFGHMLGTRLFSRPPAACAFLPAGYEGPTPLRA